MMKSSMLHVLLLSLSLVACIRKANATCSSASTLSHQHHDCNSSSSSSSSTATAPSIVPPEARPVVEPSISPRRKLQGGNNDKNAANGNAKNVQTTTAPTEVPVALPILLPTSFPTGLPPTQYPTILLTTAPVLPPSPSPILPTPVPTMDQTTLSPSTMSPTFLLVTSSPSLATLGFIDLQFSLFRPGLVSLDVILGKNAPLVKALKKGVADILCTETDFDLIDHSGQSDCTERSFVLSSSASILRNDLVEMIVRDEQLPPLLNYTTWIIRYPVVSVGQVYIDTAMANTNANGASTNANTNNDEQFQDAGIRLMERVGQLALLVELSSTAFDARLPDGVLASAVDQEVLTFLGGEGLGYTEQLDPAPLHGLRLSGIIMLVITSVLTSLFMTLASRRKKEREWDERFKELASGGLVTEEGLDFLLDAGRSSQHQQQQTLAAEKNANYAEEQINGDDDTVTNIPLPGAYMSIEYRPTSPMT